MHFKHFLTTLLFFYSASVVLTSKVHRREALPGNGTGTSDKTQAEPYEYIVIGSGPGGGPLAARLAIAGFKVLLVDAGSDQGSSYQEKHASMQWNYFVNHYSNETRQEQDTKFTWQTPSGDYFVGPDPPAGSKGLGILYPRAGTLAIGTTQLVSLAILPGQHGQSAKPGLYQLPLAVDNGTRSSLRDFIINIANAVNEDGCRKYHLDIRLNTFVTKIEFDQSGGTPRATGAQYLEGVGLYFRNPNISSQSSDRIRLFRSHPRNHNFSRGLQHSAAPQTQRQDLDQSL
ncbi:hypothetical protein EG329_001306 [Mollisiaceae sp. DMI_Dod_QoI]|nr:hypothetical protein EG329_001306 [Helotiales sp. DMI_Dod_QoI]